MRVGVAGLGRMGAPMARNLVRAGHEVSLWNRSAERAGKLAAETGARIAATPAELADHADVVVTMLADDASSEAVHFGADGLFAGTGARTFLEMGTMSPAHIGTLAARAPDGARIVDAPVSGSTAAATEATLLIMAGCTEDEGRPLAPILDAMGRRTIFLGAIGAGAVMKLAVNSLIHGLNQTLSEALTLAEAAGIDTEAAFDVIEASAAAAPMIKYRRPLYLDEASHEVTFALSLARKDMEVTAALADRLGVSLPQGQVTLAELRAAEVAGFGERDMAAMLAFMRETKG